MSAFGKKLDKQAQDTAYSVYLFFKKRCEDPNTTEYQQNMKLFPTVAKATGIPENTIVKIVMKKESKSDNSDQDHTVMKRYLVLDDIAKCEIKRRVIQFYSLYQKVPTLKAIHKTFFRQKVLVASISYLERLLREIGFKHNQVDGDSKQKILLERSSLEATRWDYLQAIHKYRVGGKTIIFVGETYISASQKAGEEDIEIFQNSKEGGFIVLHACNNEEFINEALLITQTKLNRKHYLNDMNCVDFACWVKDELLPNTPPQSVIVMRNTSYNSDAVKPTYKSTKREFESWLKNNNIPYRENLPKSDMLALVNNHPSCGNSDLDEMIKSNGHDILRIPAAHADLNPIEWIWRNVKKRLWTDVKLTSTVYSKVQAIKDTITDLPGNECQQCHDIVKKLETEYYEYNEKSNQITEEMLEKIRQKQIALDEPEPESDSQEEMEISDEDN